MVVSSRSPGSCLPSSRQLPERASLENLRNQVKTLQKQHREGSAEAIARAVWLGAGAQLAALEGPAARPSAGAAAVSGARHREPSVMAAEDIQEVSYYYGSAGYERWLADLERAPDLAPPQLGNLWFLNGWTYSSLHMNRTDYAASYLRANVEHFSPPARAPIEAAAQCYDQLRERLGKWDPSDPSFGMVKQKKLESWTQEVRARELALLRDVYAFEARALSQLGKALEAS
jgi:hypothetical protein